MKAFSSFFIALFLISVVVMGTSCTSSNNPPQPTPKPTPTNNPTPTPTADPLAVAKANFRDKVWTPFMTNNRCVFCHDFDNKHASFYQGHPDKTANCAGCHSPGDPPTGILGFGPPPPSFAWQPAPDADKWTAASDPDTVRAHILLTGPALYNHLVGTGANKTPLVQWAFFNGPDTGAGAGKIHAGAVPKTFTGQEHPTGQIPLAEPDMLDFTKFKTAVEQWLCLEAKVPGATNLGLPNTVVCP